MTIAAAASGRWRTLTDSPGRFGKYALHDDLLIWRGIAARARPAGVLTDLLTTALDGHGLGWSEDVGVLGGRDRLDGRGRPWTA